MEDQGNVETSLDIYTKNYAMESFNFPNDELNKFKSTENLEEILIKFGIKSSKSEKSKKGSYVPVKINFVSTGISNIILTLINDDDGNQIFYYWSFQVFVYSDTKCFPIIKEEKW